MLDDVVYFSSLLVCISLGSYYKKIEDEELKRNYGAGLGILIACLICGTHFYHTIFLVWGNIIIIRCCDRRYVHQMSMVYTWTYLLYMHFNLTCNTKYETWLYQAIALRLVGLAFEVNIADKSKVFQRGLPSSKFLIGDSDNVSSEPTAVDIIAYSYFFIGLHKGPYYRWKIFNDHFTGPFGVLGDCRIITEQKLKKACLCVLGYVLLNLKYSSQIYYEDNFYVNYGTDFRFLYNIPQLIMYYLQYHIVMMLCTSVCTEAGFGVYPAKCQPLPGYGPSVRHSYLKLISACSFFAWTIWCGPTLQQVILSATLWVYIHLEAEYNKLYNPADTMKLAWDIGFSIMRLFCLIYLTPCLVISDTSIVLKYYNSIFWMYHLVLLSLIVVAVILNKNKEMLRL
ncbi:lysophospholipid acyltransferase 7 [Aphomia sociella]